MPSVRLRVRLLVTFGKRRQCLPPLPGVLKSVPFHSLQIGPSPRLLALLFALLTARMLLRITGRGRLLIVV